MMNDARTTGLWRAPKGEKKKPNSGLDPDLIAAIKRAHNNGRTLAELEEGFGLDRTEIEVALAGGVYSRGALEEEKK